MNKERIYHADVIRIVACLMVVLMHSPMPSPKLILIFTSGLTYFTMPCIGLFLTLSGYLLLPVKTCPTDSFNFALGRVKKFIVPLIIWSLIYMTVNGTFVSGDIKLILHNLCSMLFYPQEGVLWYMYVLIGLYFVAPVISPWLQQTNKQTIQIYLFIWGISLVIPFLIPFISVRTGETNILYYFSGYLGYFILGYYLKTYEININPLKALLGIISCLTFYALFQLYIVDDQMTFSGVFWFLSIDSPILVVLWWNILKVASDYLMNSKSQIKDSIIHLSNISFGVYMAHILVMRYGLWKLQFIQNIDNYIIQTMVVFGLTILVTNVIVDLLSRTPIGKYIVAYKK